MLLLNLCLIARVLGEVKFPHFDCTAAASNYSSVTRCLGGVMPAWVESAGAFSCNSIGGGLTNHLFQCLPHAEAAENRQLLFRVYGEGTEAMVDRTQETEVLVNLSWRGFPTGLYGTYTNGRVERFLAGRTLAIEEMRQPLFRKIITQKMYHLHQTDMPNNIDAGVLHRAVLWANLDKFLRVVGNAVASGVIQLPSDLSVDRLREAIGRLKVNVQAANLPVTFTHGDVQCLNLLYEEASEAGGEGVLTLIDFEFAAYNYRAYDLANHLTEWMGYGPIQWHLYPNVSEQREVIKSYVAAGNLDPSAAKELEDKVLAEMQVIAPGPHLFWGLWGLVQLTFSDIDFDYKSYAFERLRYAGELLAENSHLASEEL